MADGNGNGRSGPWWARLIETVGPTAAIAIYLVYAVGVQLNSRVDANTAAITALTMSLGPHISATARVSSALQTQTAVAVQQCINQAEARRDAVAEKRCWTAWKHAMPNSDSTDPDLNP